MEQQLTYFFERHTGHPHPRVLLACSGGIDSMVLAHQLVEQNFSPGIAHCNFKLRPEADADEAWLKTWAEDNKLPFHSTAFATADYAAEHGLSTQMAARTLRYRYFEELLEQHGYDFILTAHHTDDSLETILMRLERKPELLSLAGIRPKSGKVLRPLWLSSRKDIEDYARQHQIQWREDKSNAEVYYQRNKLRHQVVPALKEALPQLTENLASGLEQMHEERLLLEQLLDEKLKQLVHSANVKQQLDVARLQQYKGIKSLLHHWLKPYGPFDLEAITASLGQFSGREFISPGYRLLLHRGQLILHPLSDPQRREYFIHKEDGHINLPPEIVFEKIDRKSFKMDPSRQVAALDFDRLRFPLVLRPWKAGDRFRPLGMKGFKKLSDFFVDENYSRLEKEQTWLLCSGEEVVWVVAARIDDRYKLTDQTKTVYFVRILNS